jgi:threonine/homoserine/homoserine lactone efflux protein
MAVGIFWGAKKPLADGPTGAVAEGAPWSAFRRGLLTQLSNPKAAVIYGSIFAALLPAPLPRPAALILLLLVFFVEAGWYSVVALALSSNRPRKAYLNWKTTIDRVAGGVLALLGIKLLSSADVAH